jgi:hypothetical protein
MPFTTPQFNLPVNLWKHLYTMPLLAQPLPPVNPPDLVFQAQLYINPRTEGANVGANTGSTRSLLVGDGFYTWLRCPPLTDIFAMQWNTNNAIPMDFVEVPAGSGRFYVVRSVEDEHKGMPNEYRIAFISLIQCPRPMP